MKLDLDDTIAALASPPGGAPRGIIRISGPGTVEVVRSVFDPADADALRSRRAAVHPGHVRLPAVATPLPVQLYLWPNRRSYTGQVLAEMHVVGSPPLLEALLSTLHAHGARPARPGEFTLRAFLAGRMDLMQAEAVLGVIDAHDHAELETALAQLAGGISGPLAAIRSGLIELLADLEAGLDFVEEDIEFVQRGELIARLEDARLRLEALLQHADGRMHSNERWRVVLAGLPNAGKSTLFNALLGREAALVSHLAGTTRDYLTAQLDFAGVGIELIDTAGREEAAEQIRLQAQQRLSEQIERADLTLWCSSAQQTSVERAQDLALLADLSACGRPVLHVVTKGDLGVSSEPGVLETSAQTGHGLDELRRAAAACLVQPQSGRQLLGSTAARCRDSLGGATAALAHALETARSEGGEELIAVDVRETLEHLGRILGDVYTDDILDRIFSKFCIGK